MEFSYGESPLQIALGTLLQRVVDSTQQTEPVEPLPEVQLSEDWNEFSKKLFKYQAEYRKTLVESRRVKNKIEKFDQALSELDKVSYLFEGTELEDMFQQLVKEYTSGINIDELKQKSRELTALSLKMKKALENTNAEQETKFQCFVCMDRYVNAFLDPCGHMICFTCWNFHQRVTCPACRQNVRPKRIYTLN